jgi:CRISPR/Cas system-associated protein Cas10 (large subunit of type III CRISPR-Cas system)
MPRKTKFNLYAQSNNQRNHEDTLSLVKKKASANSRSLNKEIIDLLDRHAKIQAFTKSDLLKEIHKAKLLFGGKLPASDIQKPFKKEENDCGGCKCNCISVDSRT